MEQDVVAIGDKDNVVILLDGESSEICEDALDLCKMLDVWVLGLGGTPSNENGGRIVEGCERQEQPTQVLITTCRGNNEVELRVGPMDLGVGRIGRFEGRVVMVDGDAGSVLGCLPYISQIRRRAESLCLPQIDRFCEKSGA